MRHILASALVLWAALIPAAHAEIPNYDVDRHCKQIAATGGASSQMMLQACYQQEQSSYDGLKPKWDSLPKAMRNHCNQIATTGGVGSYMMLEACVQQEEDAAGANAGFKFKR